jgi:hypothetical protein
VRRRKAARSDQDCGIAGRTGAHTRKFVERYSQQVPADQYDHTRLVE